MVNTNPNFIVGIGGSAGGLKAYIALLNALPPNTGMAFVVISHMGPTGDSFLTQILPQKTSMPVAQATVGMLIQANHVYVIPLNADLLVAGKVFKVISPRTIVKVTTNKLTTFDFFSGVHGDACNQHCAIWR